MFWNCRLQKANQSEHYDNAELSNSTNILISLLVFPLRMSVIGRSGACPTSAPPFSLLSAHTTAHVTKTSPFKFPNFQIVSTHFTRLPSTHYITSYNTSGPPFSLLTAPCSLLSAHVTKASLFISTQYFISFFLIACSSSTSEISF